MTGDPAVLQANWAPVDRRTALAIHEAGHAVIATRAGFPIRYVTLASRTKGSEAHVKMRDEEVEYSVWDSMAFSAAGVIAHDIGSGCRDRVFVAEGGGYDFEVLLDDARFTRAAFRDGACSERGLPQRATVRQIAVAAWADTYQRVVADYGAILAVTDALLRSHQALTSAAIRRLVEGATAVELPPHAHLAETFWPPRFMSRGAWISR